MLFCRPKWFHILKSFSCRLEMVTGCFQRSKWMHKGTWHVTAGRWPQSSALPATIMLRLGELVTCLRIYSGHISRWTRSKTQVCLHSIQDDFYNTLGEAILIQESESQCHVIIQNANTKSIMAQYLKKLNRKVFTWTIQIVFFKKYR